MRAAASHALRAVLVPPRVRATPPARGQAVHRLQGQTMGTTWSVSWVGLPGVDAAAVRHVVARELHIVVDQMSTWEPTSSLCTYNTAPACTWVPIPDALRGVLQAAQQVAQASGGAFDASAGPLVALWGFGAERSHDEAGYTPPDDDALARTRACCGWQRLRLGADGAWQPGGLQLDLSAIAKGHAVDRICERLRDLGLHNVLVEIGGELRGHGTKPDGQPWWVAIEPPPGSTEPAPVLAAHDVAVATSGNYRRGYRDPSGRWQSHTIDPRCGRPIHNGVVSVTVVHPLCMLADAWSTALTVLGAAPGLALARRHQLAARIVTQDHRGVLSEASSPAWCGLLD
jgi:FAD:protein FMN transferase